MKRESHRKAFRVERLEDRIALSGFGDAVSDQAQSQDQGSFGHHQADYAHTYGGLGDFNRDGGSSKVATDSR